MEIKVFGLVKTDCPVKMLPSREDGGLLRQVSVHWHHTNTGKENYNAHQFIMLSKTEEDKIKYRNISCKINSESIKTFVFTMTSFFTAWLQT